MCPSLALLAFSSLHNHLQLEDEKSQKKPSISSQKRANEGCYPGKFRRMVLNDTI